MIASLVYAQEILSSVNNEPKNIFIIIQLGVKQILFLAIAVSTFLFYIKWLNRWFEKHSQAEFQIRQLHLDFERASWIVETVFEWNKESNGNTLPAELLGSLTRNLFANVSEDTNQPKHPSDQFMNAILGSASKIKVKSGDTDFELSGKGYRNAEKVLKRE